LIPGIEIGDMVMPTLTMKVLPPMIAGIVLAAPMAAIMSTVDSLLILVSATIVKDVYINYIKKDATEKQIKRISFWVTATIGIAVVLFALSPPDLIIWLNLFAFGGLESVFIWPVIMGLYWPGGNKYGAVLSMIVGMGSFMIIDRFYPNPFGMHTVVMPIVLSLIAYVLMSKVTNAKHQLSIE
jgi:sodium/pantothenate symporter